MEGPPAQVTLVAVPRERFAVTRRYLAREAAARGFVLLRSDNYLTPNEARNLGLRHVRTPYVVFIDNDVVPSAGWLGKLLECAETTGAWVVGPMYFIGEPEREEIHMAAGDAHIEQWRGGRRFVDRHRFAGKRPAEVRRHLLRMPCEQVEFHCMLVRTEVFEQIGSLDEGLRSVCEHSDLCLLVRQHGHQVYFEPDSVVTYITTGRFRWSDYRFFFSRWSDSWNEVSVQRFRDKWALHPDDPGTKAVGRWATAHRQIPLDPLRHGLKRLFGWRWGRWLGDTFRRVTPLGPLRGSR